jgi:hypothetical protein
MDLFDGECASGLGMANGEISSIIVFGRCFTSLGGVGCKERDGPGKAGRKEGRVRGQLYFNVDIQLFTIIE